MITHGREINARKGKCHGNRNLRLLSLVPKDETEQCADDDSHEEPDGIVLRVSPIRPVLLPEASFALNRKGLRVFRREKEVL